MVKYPLLFLSMLSVATNPLTADNGTGEVSENNYLGFEAALGLGGCYEENIQPPADHAILLNRPMLSGSVNLKASYKRIAINAGFVGPYEYSVNIAESGNRQEGDFLIKKDSELKYGDYGVSTAWCLNDPAGLNIQPRVGYRWYYIKSNIEAEVRSTGEIITIEGENKGQGIELGAASQIPIWRRWRDEWLTHQISIQLRYSYHFTKYHNSDFGFRPVLSLYLKGSNERIVRFFIDYSGTQGIGINRRYLLLGSVIDINYASYFE